MAYGEKAISSLVRNDLSLLKDYNLHLNLFHSCLHFIKHNLEPIWLQTVCSHQITLMSNVVRNLN
ncbi:MAG: hypothetical protein ACTS4V_00140 [Candidatus Hodgkinia cicadicola]